MSYHTTQPHKREQSSTPLISVVMPTFKRPAHAAKALKALLQQDFPPTQYEIIVVDSSPDDLTENVVRELQGSARCDLQYHRLSPEFDIGPKRNHGVAHARGEIL